MTTGEQLTLDVDAALVDQLRDRCRSCGDDRGAARLLRALICRGLADHALPMAAVIVLALDAEAGER